MPSPGQVRRCSTAKDWKLWSNSGALSSVNDRVWYDPWRWWWWWEGVDPAASVLGWAARTWGALL